MMNRELEECPDCGGELEEEEYGYVCDLCGEVIQEENEEFLRKDGIVEEL